MNSKFLMWQYIQIPNSILCLPIFSFLSEKLFNYVKMTKKHYFGMQGPIVTTLRWPLNFFFKYKVLESEKS